MDDKGALGGARNDQCRTRVTRNEQGDMGKGHGGPARTNSPGKGHTGHRRPSNMDQEETAHLDRNIGGMIGGENFFILISYLE